LLRCESIVASAKTGDTIPVFITGAGDTSPAIATGYGPPAGTPVSSLPQPGLPVAVTVGGQGAGIQFAGIPVGLVGVTQINFTIPAGLAPGVQPVVVTVGGVASEPVNLTVTQ
jgi:uncharacterized protein (TIGR03437 family)